MDLFQSIKEQFETYVNHLVDARMKDSNKDGGLTEDAVRDIAREEADEALSNATFETTVN